MDKLNNKRIVMVLVVLAAVLLAYLFPYYCRVLSFPHTIGLPVGQSQAVHFKLPLLAQVRLLKGSGLKLNQIRLTNKPIAINLARPLMLETADIGQSEMEFSLFGIPWRRVLVQGKIPDKVVPGGHAVGVLLTSEGIIVVGYDNVSGPNTNYLSPAREAGIQPGDLILQADGITLLTVADLVRAVDQAGHEGRSLAVQIRRGTETREISLMPVQTAKGNFRIGLYVRDGTNGVGTMSFYDPSTGFFGALGHVVTDVDTGTTLMIRHGSIVKALISSINVGIRGQPGEKIGVFQPGDGNWGTIIANTDFGIFGRLEKPLENPYFMEAIPVALAGEVYPGPAEMYTVLERDRIEKFQVEIERVINQYSPSDKGMVLRITDPRLLEKAGGIVQGMSGSPIIQNGKLAGIVTHVFVNDPSRGFGILAEWMVEKGKTIWEGAEKAPLSFRMFLPSKEDYGKQLSNTSC
ncbi:MAG: SpoIVB peptidase [Firmicutes bacterium]|nr:SpoIVB peptidase [Bacillota bacterium]